MESLVLAVAQPASIAGDVAANATLHAGAIHASGARVVAFPELSLTGYHLDADPIAPDDVRLQPMVDACAATGAVAFAGAPVTEGGRDHIAVLLLDAAGARVAYRKVWLGGAERRRFTPGTGPAAVDVDGWRLGLAVCKDTGVPEHAAATAAIGIDVYVAGLVDAAADARVQEERARRIATDHGVWVAFASMAGSTGEGYDETAGRSGVWSPDGIEVARASTAPGEVVTVMIPDTARSSAAASR